MSTENDKKLWDGRFNEATDAFVEEFTASVNFDRILATYDITGSVAHATMLAQAKVLTSNELELIKSGLEEIRTEILNGSFTWSVSLEDVHMNIEKALTDKIAQIEVVGNIYTRHVGRE